MNIFATDDDPCIAARALDDKRVNKMVVESGQMLSTALRLHGCQSPNLYKAAFANHPCSVWARRTRGNFEWLCLHALFMCSLYEEVYGRRHKTTDIILSCIRLVDHIPVGAREPFVNCSLDKNILRPVTDCYRDTMNTKWAKDKYRPTWQGRNKPEWYRNLGGNNA